MPVGVPAGWGGRVHGHVGVRVCVRVRVRVRVRMHNGNELKF